MSIENCIICERSETFEYIHLKSNNLVALKCRRCGHVFVKNSPITPDNINEFYTMDDFKGKRSLQELEYPDYYSDCFADYEQKSNSSLVLKQFEEKATYFDSQFPKGGKILDVGCATGVFLDMMKKRGWEVEGVEVSDELASYARDKFGAKVHVMDLTREKLDSGPFHVITLFDVIEHIPDPNLMIAACKDLLVENGLLFLRTPTEEALLRDIAKGFYWITFKKVDFPMSWFYSFEHLHSFSLKTLKYLLRKHGLVISKVFREEESLERLTISSYVKAMMSGVNQISSWMSKQHKVAVVAGRDS